MYLDVQELKNFYYRSALGRAVQKSLRGEIYKIWPEAKALNVVGYGFAVPVLRHYLPHARRVVALMPAPQGVCAWPQGLPNVTALSYEDAWPLDTGQVDRLIVMHALEFSERPTDLLEECARVLGPGGRALFIVPSRASVWARRETTPLGHGRPYSLAQLEAQLREHGFVVERSASALFGLPVSGRFWLRVSQILEKSGRHFSALYPGGVVLVEVSKRVTPLTGTGSKDILQSALGVLAPKPQTQPTRSVPAGTVRGAALRDQGGSQT